MPVVHTTWATRATAREATVTARTENRGSTLLLSHARTTHQTTAIAAGATSYHVTPSSPNADTYMRLPWYCG